MASQSFSRDSRGEHGELTSPFDTQPRPAYNLELERTASKNPMRKPMILLTSVAVLALVGAYTLLRGASKSPAPGSPAPDFTLNSQDGQPVKLSSFRGQWVVLYFYPKDFTSGCSVEAHNFQCDLAEYQKRNAVILGVSVQDEASHKQFCAKEGLNFKLLADVKTEVSRSYSSVIIRGSEKLPPRPRQKSKTQRGHFGRQRSGRSQPQNDRVAFLIFGE